ncbi:NUDIX domain-containing protein [Gordonia alkaliphila]|uniref:(deoxy)nucleoside triphosphate pyrophosphohydrolase n=1 Tax=Gordonia alkaliphila TaxID=1053547 RepID=UPI001FF4F8DD|nr:NUDIX domain-containing protein [Gordonia alkaliphila]MCK0438119.1 NUDIX domain-containing protein [Gordonia alkaliphila]
MRFVVAGAVVRERVERELLLAQRSYPADVAGLWELPGGKLAPGETAPAALVRELTEELTVTVRPGAALTQQVLLQPDLTLIAHWATLVDGVPRAVEHQGLTWVDADGLASMAAGGELVPADTAWVPELLTYLRGRDSAGPS